MKKFDLIIAGHSHGGQIRLGSFRMHNKGSKYFDSGKYVITDKTTLYVNNGIGLTFFCRLELEWCQKLLIIKYKKNVKFISHFFSYNSWSVTIVSRPILSTAWKIEGQAESKG